MTAAGKACFLRFAFVLLFLIPLFCLLPSSASAADPAPGDACTVADSYALAGGPENSGKIFLMTCQSSVWVRVMETTTAGSVGIKRATPQAPLDVAGELKVGTTTGLACNSNTEGAIRYNSGTKLIEYCNLTSWTPIIATVACDSIPDSFNYTDQTALSLSTLTESNILAISGTDPACNSIVSVSGSGSPQFRVCSDSLCLTPVLNWTATATSIAMNGPRYLQVRGTTSANPSTAHNITVNVGGVANIWSITTTSTGPCGNVGPGDEGTICSDGSIYAGVTPDGNRNMYVTRCDLGQSWDGSACTGTRETHTWNDGSTNYIYIGTTQGSGAYNTSRLVVEDSNNDGGAGLEPDPHNAALACYNSTLHGQTDWYLPAWVELQVIYEKLQDGTPNDNLPNPPMVSGFSSGSYYWHSWETNAWTTALDGRNFFNWGQDNLAKSSARFVRCARKD